MRRESVLPSSFTYFRQHSFNRISDLAQFGFTVTPQGCTQLVAEISCDVGDRAWQEDEFAKESVLADLVREGLLSPDEVIEMHVFRAQHAYPVYALNTNPIAKGCSKHSRRMTIWRLLDARDAFNTSTPTLP